MVKINSFFHLLYNDLIKGVIQRYKYFLLAFLFFSFVCFELGMRINNSQCSIFDFILKFFVGNEPFDINSKEKIDIPIIWIMFHSILSLIVGFYVSDDIKKSASALIIRVQSKRIWWSSKFVWCIFSVLVYYIVFIFTVILFCLIFGNLSIVTNTDITEKFFKIDISLIKDTDIILVFFIMPMISSIAISVFQVVLGLIIKPIYSFMLIVTIMVCSSFYSNTFLLFNFSMISRYNYFSSKSNITLQNGLVISICLIVISYIWGMIVIKRKDII